MSAFTTFSHSVIQSFSFGVFYIPHEVEASENRHKISVRIFRLPVSPHYGALLQTFAKNRVPALLRELLGLRV